MEKMGHVTGPILGYMRSKLKKKYGNQTPKRGFHAKTIGLVKAELKVDDSIEDFLKVGLFKEPRTYNSWVRFTNGSSTVSPDGKTAGIFGMAIKVLIGDSGEYVGGCQNDGNTQDIILSNSPIFVPSKTHLQLNGVKVAMGNVLEAIINIVPVLLQQTRAAISFLGNRIKSPNVLEEMYYSATPYSFGQNRVIKWHARPLKTISSVMPEKPAQDFLREELTKDLSVVDDNPIAYALFVQFCENRKTEPIDDSSVEWKTPFHRVATIMFPAQDINSKERNELDKRMSYSPGHSIEGHGPLGNVNMVRKVVYEELARDRCRPTKQDIESSITTI